MAKKKNGPPFLVRKGLQKWGLPRQRHPPRILKCEPSGAGVTGKLKEGGVGLLQSFVSDTPASTNRPRYLPLVLYMQITAMIYLLEKPIFHNNALSSWYLLFKLL